MGLEFRQLVFDRPDLPQNLKPVAEAYLRNLNAELKERQIVETPRILLLADQVLASYLVVRLIEQRLWSCSPPKDDEEPGTVKACQLMPIEASGKASSTARERHRKSIRDIEEACAKGTARPLGIADRMKPVFKKAEGVLEEILAHADAKRRAANIAMISNDPDAARRLGLPLLQPLPVSDNDMAKPSLPSQ